MLDRLKLDDKRIAGMANGLREVAALPDPVGKILDERIRPNGLKLQKISTPIGVVVIIYESRPNVTADAASLCFKSGNATILRGGKEALNSNQIIAKTMIDAGKIAHRAVFPNTRSRSCPRPTARRFRFCCRSRNTLTCACRAAAKVSSAPWPTAASCPSSNITKASATSSWMPMPI